MAELTTKTPTKLIILDMPFIWKDAGVSPGFTVTFDMNVDVEGTLQLLQILSFTRSTE